MMMNDIKISFEKPPNSVLKCRSDFQSSIKTEDEKVVVLNVNNARERRCTLVIKLLLKEPDNVLHFYHLCSQDSSQHKDRQDKYRVGIIERDLIVNERRVKLDFFGIRKALKKDAMSYLNENFQNNVESIYKKNCSTVILEITLIDTVTRIPYDILKFEFRDKMDNIIVKAFSPRVLLFDDASMELTFVVETPEKDVDSICLEMKVKETTKIIPTKEFPKATNKKNVFLFVLKHMDIQIGEFRARLFRKGQPKVYSDYSDFKVIRSDMENVKRKSNSDYDYEPASKISRTISSSISENSLSEVNITDYMNCPTSTLSFIVKSSKQDLRGILEKKILASIARVGHDFAFGRPITDNTKNITQKLPIVYILQDDVGDTPLHNAILQNHEDRAMEILKIVHQNFPNELFTRNTSNHTALILSAACQVSADFVQLLLYYGFNVSDKDCDGNNAITIAIEYKNTEILRTLVQDAIIKKSFDDDYYEIANLIKKTIYEQYFDGYEILMNSYKGLNISLDDSYLDPSFQETWNYFATKLNNDLTPLPELYGDCMDNIEEEIDVAIFLNDE